MKNEMPSRLRLDRQQFISDILTNAIEGPGIAYWTDGGEIGYNAKKEYVSVEIRANEEAMKRDQRKWRLVTATVIEAGIEFILSGVVGVRADLIGQIAVAHARNDASAMDGEGIDVLIQAALFREIVFG